MGEESERNQDMRGSGGGEEIVFVDAAIYHIKWVYVEL